MNTAVLATSRAFTLIVLTTVSATGTDQTSSRQRDWRMFTSRAGWSIKYPRDWRLNSCGQCDDPTEPDAFLFLSDPSGDQTVMIERLADRPEDRAVELWLREVAKDTVLTPIKQEEWITLSGSKALKVINEKSENIYAVHGSLTVAIRYDRPVEVVNQIVSTFKFQHRK